MKLVVTKTQDGTVLTVRVLSKYVGKRFTSEAEVISCLDENNLASGYERFVVLEVPSEMEEVFNFILGEKQYKTTWDIEDLCDRADEVKGMIESVSSDVYDIEQTINKISDIVSKLKEDVSNHTQNA